MTPIDTSPHAPPPPSSAAARRAAVEADLLHARHNAARVLLDDAAGDVAWRRVAGEVEAAVARVSQVKDEASRGR